MRCCASLRHSDLTNNSNRPPSYGGEGAGSKGYDMNTIKAKQITAKDRAEIAASKPLIERITIIQEAADKLGVGDPEFNQRAFSDEMWESKIGGS